MYGAVYLSFQFEIIFISVKDYILASTVIGAGLQCAIMLSQDLRTEDFPTGPYYYFIDIARIKLRIFDFYFLYMYSKICLLTDKWYEMIE